MWNKQGCPISGFILDHACSGERKSLLENLSKRNIAPVLKEKGIAWHGFYSLRRFHGTKIRKESGSSDNSGEGRNDAKSLKRMAGTTGLEPAASAVTV
jgi:hypothetical protein